MERSMQLRTAYAWVLACALATASTLMMAARVEAGEVADELRKAEAALAEMAGRNLTDEQATEAAQLEKRVEKLRSKAAEEEPAYKLRTKYGEVQKRIEELESQDLSAEGTPDRWELLTDLKAQRQELGQAIESGPRRENPERREASLRANIEEYSHAIANLEDQGLSAEGTPDRWATLQSHRAKRKELINALERMMAERRAKERGGVTERLHGVEMRMEALREEVGDRDWTEEEHGRMKRLEDIAAELRGVMRKQRERAERPSNEKRRRVARKVQQPKMRLEAFRLEHADGHHVADLVIKFLPEGSEIAYDENTRHLIVLTYGAGVEYVQYLLGRLDAPAVE